MIENMAWRDNSGVYQPSMRTKYYKLSIQCMTVPLFKDLMSKYIDPFDKITVKELKLNKFEQAVLAKKDEASYFFAYKENKVIFIQYYGSVDLLSRLDEIADVID